MSQDFATAHRHFSADCFNRAWDLLDKPVRTPDEDAMLLHLCHTSLWHWMQREDCTPRSLSVGNWQVSRAYAVLGDAVNARRFGELCLKHSGNEPAFFLAYAHEALARAARLAGECSLHEQHLAEALRLASEVADIDERALLEKDLDSLR